MPTDWLHHPPRDASLMPFWFWNDAISADDIRRSIADFEAHGVYGFVIHPRVGLPRSIGWMSDAMLDLMQVAIEEAASRDMRVILYDEGMYPSGSSNGQVVASDPSLATRCLALHDADRPMPAAATVVTRIERDGKRLAIVDRPADSYIRGLHYVGDGPQEDEPPAGDILNPRTTQRVIELVYDKFADRFRPHFGETILGIFTDEPNPLGKCREPGVLPFTSGILPQLHRLTGEDFSTQLPALWDPTRSDLRERYLAAVRLRLDETWYAPLSDWCERHGVWLMGHPDRGDEIGVQRFFHVPGHDLVWRWVEPGKPTAIEGHESTQGKCTASAKLHLGRRRNSNEFCGAYGHETTFDEVRWLARWCLVRGVDLLIPHAFYYSIRGPRRDERPPQLGPHTATWTDGSFARFAAECQRLCALNMAGTPVCDIAILTQGDRCPWQAAKVCFEHQRDFHYVESTSVILGNLRGVDEEFEAFRTTRYRILIVDGEPSSLVVDQLAALNAGARVIQYDGDPSALLAALDRLCPCDVVIDPPNRDLRVRHVRVDGDDVYLFFNEGNESMSGRLTLAAKGDAAWIDPETGDERPAELPLRLELHRWQIAVLRVRP